MVNLAQSKPIAQIQDTVTNNQVKELGKPTLLYFYASWCGACKTFSPVWQDIVSLYGDKYNCIKVDVDDSKNDDVANKFNIRVIPQVYIYDEEFSVKRKLVLMRDMSGVLDSYLNERQSKRK